MSDYKNLIREYFGENKSKAIDVKLLLAYRGYDSGLPNRYSEEEALALFKKDSVVSHDETIRFPKQIHRWQNTFGSSQYLWPRMPDVTILEPFIARYILAVNSIGSRTNYSCDGWHSDPNKTKAIYFRTADRYSLIWIKIVDEHALEDKTIGWKYLFHENQDVTEAPIYEASLKLPKDDRGKLAIYDRINKAAAEIESKRDFLRDSKIRVVEELKGKHKNGLTVEEVERLMLEHSGFPKQ